MKDQKGILEDHRGDIKDQKGLMRGFGGLSED